MYVVKDNVFNTIHYIQNYVSIVWVENYTTPGECEIELLVDDDIRYNNIYILGNFIYKSGSDYIMIITDVQYSSSIEQGNSLIVKGKSFRYILSRRVLLYNPVEEYTDTDWNYFPGEDTPKDISGPITTILKDTFVVPKIPESVDWGIPSGEASTFNNSRRLTNPIGAYLYLDDVDFNANFQNNLAAIINNMDYYFQDSESQGELSMVPMSLNYNIGTTMEEFLDGVLTERGISYKFIYDDDNKKVKLVPYIGNDLTKEGTPFFVFFSPSFNNVSSCNYDINDETHKNIAYVHTDFYDTETNSSYVVSKPFGNKKGIDRKEVYLDVSDDDYDKAGDRYSNIILQSKAYTYLAIDCKLKKELNAEAVTDDKRYIYKQQYFLGDIVLFKNPFGENERVRVTSYTYTSDINGDNEYPTFSRLSDRGI